MQRGAQTDVHDHAKQWNYDVWVIDDGVSDQGNRSCGRGYISFVLSSTTGTVTE